jgi:GNAT superfamily N-acetyltransferase
MIAADLPRVQAVADEIHVAHPEGKAVFCERLRLYPAGCFVLAAADGPVLGYVVSHPWHDAPPALDSPLGALPRIVTTYYIHDVALKAAARGGGAARAIITRLLAHARDRGWPNVSLVAVNGSGGFWQALGFRPAALPGHDRKLASYGADAVRMARALR